MAQSTKWVEHLRQVLMCHVKVDTNYNIKWPLRPAAQAMTLYPDKYKKELMDLVVICYVLEHVSRLVVGHDDNYVRYRAAYLIIYATSAIQKDSIDELRQDIVQAKRLLYDIFNNWV